MPTSNARCATAVLPQLLMLLQLVLICRPQAVSAVEPSLVLSGAFHYRNGNTNPNTVEMPHNQSWQVACQWTRRNASETLFLAIEAPSQRGPCNCQFSTLSGPAVCTPSNLQFETEVGTQKSNLTCKEAGNTLTCSIDLAGFNPYHIGAWSCKSLSDNKNDTIFLQYYKILPKDSLVLASWDPISPGNITGNSSNRFECFTKSAVIPPARLTYYLGGIELSTGQTRYPIDWLSNTILSVQPNTYGLNASAGKASPTAPRRDLALNQQLLASNRVLELQLHRSYNGLVLQCVANQGLSASHPKASQHVVLHLDDHSGGSEVTRRLSHCLLLSTILWLTAAVTIW